MGKNKKRFNWKARQVIKTDIDNTEQRKIQVEEGGHRIYDECNALVLPSKKRKTKIRKDYQKPETKLLSKKHKKKLQKIVERKKLKAERASMIEALSRVQASSEELGQMTSITSVQTKGLKRLFNDGNILETRRPDPDGNDNSKPVVVNALKGNNKRRKLLAALMSTPCTKQSDPNIVGLESSSDDVLSDSDVESESNEFQNKKMDEPQSFDGDEKSPKNTDEEISLNSQPQSDINISEKKLNELKTKTCGNSTDSEPRVRGESKSKIEISRVPLLPRKKAVFVPVLREKSIEETRKKLPIIGEEQTIMEAISDNPVIILCGETGSGKTTQVPQFLYEAGYASNGKMIGVTEPRRVAAIAMSKRVGLELSLSEKEVSYLVRFEGNTTPSTKIKFMTDGVLLKEIHADFLLSCYSVIVVDEAHERSVATDVVLGLLSRIVPLREKKGKDPLKLIIMSATLRIQDFTENKHLFPKPPLVIKVESRQFPVTVHFNKRTNPDYLKETYRKVCRIHSQLPEGGILVFLTGQQEVKTLVKKLRTSFPVKKKTDLKEDKKVSEKGCSKIESNIRDEEEEDEEICLKSALKRVKQCLSLPKIDLDKYDSTPVDDAEMELLDDYHGEGSTDEDGFGSSDNEEDALFQSSTAQPVWALPFYSLLPSDKQAKVFQGAPEGFRLCVVSTNVSETSLTIPGIKYVVDCGKVKRKFEDKYTGVTGFRVVWESKAEADQRAGRAGRVCPGHAYRLYSSAVFNDNFSQWSEPEIKRRGIEDLVLNMKSLGIHRVSGFPFPTPPDREQLEAAERALILLGAIEPPPPLKDKYGGRLTPLGESMSALPLGPRFAKMVCLSQEHSLVCFTLSLASGLSVQEFLLPPQDEVTKIKRRKIVSCSRNSLLLGDLMVVLKAVGGTKKNEFLGLGVREKALIEARKLRNQLTNQVALACPHLDLNLDPGSQTPDDTQARLLRQIVLSGYVDRVAKLVTGDEEGSSGKVVKKGIPEYETMEVEQRVKMSKDSVLSKEKPNWVVYQEAYIQNEKMFIRGITAIEPEWLLLFAPSLCKMSEPLQDPPPIYDSEQGIPRCHVNSTYGKRGWILPTTEIEFPESLERYKWFCVFILEGKVFPKIEKFVGSLLSTPQTMIKPWAKLQPRTEMLLKTLVAREADSKDKLLNIWSSDKLYLLSAYQKWLPGSASNEVAKMWPPL